MLAIYKRELRAYMHSFIGLLFVGVSLFFVGLYYTNYNLLYGYPYFGYTISSVIYPFLVSIPILSMKILAEERHNKTDQLIITAPITVGKIVAGKYLALLTIFAIPTAIVGTYPLILNHFGATPLGEDYAALLAYFLYGMAAIAIGVLISALTESQVIAAVLCFAVLFIGNMMSGICGLISAEGNLITKILGCFDMYTPFSSLLYGTLDVTAVVYFITLTCLALFFATQVIQKRRYSVSVKQLSFGAYSSGMILVAVAVAVVANMVVAKLPLSWTSLDVTEQQLYSVTDQTKDYLKTLDEDITIYVLTVEGSEDTTVGKTLDYYEDLSKHITVTYVDMIANPSFASQYTSDSLSINSVIVVGEKRSKAIDYYDLYATQIDYTTYESYTTGYDGEGQITSAIDYVTSDDMPVVYMTEGHGEKSLSSTFQKTLEKENIEYTDVNLMNLEAVPEDAACLVIYAPENDFNADDAAKVVAYLEQGGKVVFISGNNEVEMPNCQTILDYMGITLAPGVVVETDNNKYYQTPVYLLPYVSYSTYTSGVSGKYYVFAPYSQGFVVPESTDEIAYKSFLTTSDGAYSKVNLYSTTVDKEEGDVEGPFAIGVEAVKTLEEGEATLVAYSSSEMFTDEASSMVSGANQLVFSNTISSFVDHEVSISIPAKSYEMSYITMSSTDVISIGLLVTIILPLGCLVTGFVIWFRRRRK